MDARQSFIERRVKELAGIISARYTIDTIYADDGMREQMNFALEDCLAFGNTGRLLKTLDSCCREIARRELEAGS